MKTYISILRGINVGGKNPIKMNTLQEMYICLGFRNVRTYIQSGNVVFQWIDLALEELEQYISEEFLKWFAIKVPVLVRKYTEMKNILACNPFLDQNEVDIAHLHITLLSKYPESHILKNLDHVSYLPDQFSVDGRTIYLSCPNGYGKTKLTNSFFESKSGDWATTRNLRTIIELVKIGALIENNQD